jgi:glycosyltransferase involved in cell wall biosynthesis
MDMIVISVLMCVYNREKYLPAAIESILNQSFRDFEFVIVNDGSTDKSKKILDAFAQRDSRINIIEEPKNVGIIQALTTGIRHCSGKYIARMDSDDLSTPDRLQVQVDFMETHPEVDILGSAYEIIDESGAYIGSFGSRPSDPKLTWFQMFYHSAIINGTIIAKAEVYKRFNQDKLEEGFTACEDIAYFLRMGFDYTITNMNMVLYKIRTHRKQISDLKENQQREGTVRATQIALTRLFGVEIPGDVIKSYYYVLRFTVDNVQTNLQALHVMYHLQTIFEKRYKLNREQKTETRRFTYERLKNYTMKYRKHLSVAGYGVILLGLLMPAELINNFVRRIFRRRSIVCMI